MLTYKSATVKATSFVVKHEVISGRTEYNLTAPLDRQQIYEQAADWAECTATLTAAEQQQLSAWLEQDPLHQQAYQDCLQCWQNSSLDNPALLANVSPAISKVKPVSRWQQLTLAMSACLLAVLLISWQFWPDSPPHLAFDTLASEQLQRALPDGSEVWVAGDSNLEYLQHKQGRLVRLHRGEALFNVSHLSKTNVFAVDTGDTQVRVTGTRFSVEKTPLGADIIVLEGSVVVSTSTGEVTLTQGQRLQTRQLQLGAVQQLWPDYQHHLLSHWLDARNERLDTVIRKLERQGAIRVMLSDPALADLLINGRFNLNTPAESLTLLAEANQLQLSQMSNQQRFVLSAHY